MGGQFKLTFVGLASTKKSQNSCNKSESEKLIYELPSMHQTNLQFGSLRHISINFCLVFTRRFSNLFTKLRTCGVSLDQLLTIFFGTDRICFLYSETFGNISPFRKNIAKYLKIIIFLTTGMDGNS